MFKQAVWPEYFRWLENCAMPSIIGKTAPKQAGDVQRTKAGEPATGAKPLSAAEAMAQALTNLKNASVAVLPNGSEIDQLEVVGEGAGFERSINVADGQITKGILFQTLATSEAQFGTRAQSQTHMQVLDLLVWWLKGKIAGMIKADLVKQVIRYNFGVEFLQFAPIITLGDTERRDWSKDATAAASLSSVITESQWLSITNQLGLPAPRPGELPRGQARQANQPQQQNAKQLNVEIRPDSKEQLEPARRKRGWFWAHEVGPMGDPL
jgi:phage gp29-like protein